MNANIRFWCMSITLVAAFVGFRLLPHGKDVPLAAPLSSLPSTLDQWHGLDDPLDATTIKALGVTDYLNRVYRGEDGIPVGLYVGYYSSQQTDETSHSPKNCLPGSGWQPLKSDFLFLNLPDGRAVQVNQVLIQKGLEQQMVLYWYQSHGRIIASEYSAKVFMVVDAVRLHRTDAALVRINTPIMKGEKDDRAAKFAVAVMGKLDRLIPN